MEPVDHPRFLTDERGNRLGVMLPIDRYLELLEDFADLETFSKRMGEPHLTLEDLLKRLSDEGVL